MNKKEEALHYHSMGRSGKIQVIPTKPHSTQRDLALAYSPGVAEPCIEIEKDPRKAYNYTAKGNLVAVISNGTAVLGLGDIGPLAGKPVMEGKGLLFKIFADIDVFDIEVDAKDPELFIQTVKAIAPTFGGINLEDIKAPEAFEIERRLKEELDIPVMHDDQHGTAIISTAALLGALEVAGKKIEEARIVVNGAGAAAISCTKLYMMVGARAENILMLDSKGVINSRRTGLTPEKLEFVRDTDLNTLEEAVKGADVFIGLSKGNVMSPEMLLSMAENPIVFALANPDPEIEYDLAVQTRSDVIMATGRSDTPNQVNNVLGFPYIFRGALDVEARKINDEMKIAAVYAIAGLTKKPVPQSVLLAYNLKSLSFGKDYIIPKPFDPRLITEVSMAVARAAIESGVASRKIEDWKKYEEELRDRLSSQNKLMRIIQSAALTDPKRIVYTEADHLKVLRAAFAANQEGSARPILLGPAKKIREKMKANNIEMDVPILDPTSPEMEERVNEYARAYWKEQHRNGVTFEDARSQMQKRDYFGAMMLKRGEADGLITGHSKSFDAAARPLVEIIGKEPGRDNISTVNVVNTARGPLFLADTSVNEDPSVDDLTHIALNTASLAKYFDVTPRVAMISHSNFGSLKSENAEKMKCTTQYLHRNYPELIVDGEIQPDYALNEKLLDDRYPFSQLAGKEGANVLIFPSVESASISFKLIKGMDENNVSVGPILLGLNKAAHIADMGASSEEILNLTYIAVVDAQKRENDSVIDR